MPETPNDKPTLSWSQPASIKPVVSVPTVPPVMPLQTTSPSFSDNSYSSSTGTYVGIFVAGIIVGALIGWGISSVKNTGNSLTASSTAVTATSTKSGSKPIDLTGSTIGGSDFSIDTVQHAGYNVPVSKVAVQKPTWFAVYDNVNGQPGKALGAVLFYPVAHEGSIELLRPMIAGHTYLIGRTIDNGDNAFTPATDTFVTDSNGTALFTTISAQ